MKVTTLNRGERVEYRTPVETPCPGVEPLALDDEPLEEWEAEVSESARKEAAEIAEALSRDGYAVAISEPGHEPPIFDWVESLACEPMSEEPLEAKRYTLELRLIGGEPGDFVRVEFETHVTRNEWPDSVEWEENPGEVKIKAVEGGRFYRGVVKSTANEMNAALVALRGAPQGLAERALESLTIKDHREQWPAKLYARLAVGERCQACGRELTDSVSRVLGVGPYCAKRLRLKHSQEMAERVAALRAEA